MPKYKREDLRRSVDLPLSQIKLDGANSRNKTIETMLVRN